MFGNRKAHGIWVSKYVIVKTYADFFFKRTYVMHVLNKIGCINGKITRQIRKDVNLFYSSLFTHRVVKYKVF